MVSGGGEEREEVGGDLGCGRHGRPPGDVFGGFLGWIEERDKPD